MENFTGSDAEELVKTAIAAKLKANSGIFPWTIRSTASS